VSCATEPVADAELIETRWILRTLAGEPLHRESTPPYLQLREHEGALRAFGKSGCNSYTGACTLEGGTLSFGMLAGTRMACSPEVMELESRYLATLERVTRFEIRGSWLILEDPEGEELGTFEAWYE
jgi:heat shock protein HslJ